MKIALCLSGQLRNILENWDHIKSTLVDPNKADVFLHSDIWYFYKERYLDSINNMSTTKRWWDYKTNNWATRRGPGGEGPGRIGRLVPHKEPVPRKEPFISNERDAEIIVETMKRKMGDCLKGIFIDPDNITFTDNEKRVLCEENYKYHPAALTDPYRDPAVMHRPYVQFKRVKSCQKLATDYAKDNGFEYDYIIRARTDSGFRKPISVKDVVDDPRSKNIWGQKIHAFCDYHPDVNPINGQSDNYPQIRIFEGFAFGTVDTMTTYCNFVDDYGKYFVYTNPSLYGTKCGLFHAQRLAMHLHHNGIKMIPIRHNGYKPANWAPANYTWYDYEETVNYL